MSLAIGVVIPEGIVIAADSRQSYRNKRGMARIGSDSATKIFSLSKRVGMAITGPAFLPEGGTLKNVSKFIEDLEQEYDMEGMSLKEISKIVKDHFEEKYDYKSEAENVKKNIEGQLKQQGAKTIEVEGDLPLLQIKYKDANGQAKVINGSIPAISIIVAGYNTDGSHQAYTVYVPGPLQEKKNSEQSKKEYGALWVGQTNSLIRIVKGFEPGIFDVVPFAQKAVKQLGQEKVQKQMVGVEYAISWGTMTLQDAVDFAVLMIKITGAMQRFSDGIIANPGEMPGVGGPVDVAVLTFDKGFVWVSKKNLEANGQEINLSKIKKLPQKKTETKTKGK